MKFNVFIGNVTIIKAAAIVEKHCLDEEFLARLCAIKSFNLYLGNGKDVAQTILNNNIEMAVKPYTTWSPWSKVIGYATKGTIYCNTRKFDLPLIDRCENFFHEPLHLMRFKHKGNLNNEFNRGTVPYLAAKMFRDYVIEKGICHD